MPTTRFTLAPFASVVPGLGRSLSTRPFFFFVETRRVILPTRQWAFEIAARALATVLPSTFGTTQWRLGGGGGGGGGVVLIVQLREAGVGSALPAASVALTVKVWEPSARPEYVFGEPQAAKATPSSEHAKVEPGSVALKAKVAADEVGFGAGEVIVVSGGIVSTRHV